MDPDSRSIDSVYGIVLLSHPGSRFQQLERFHDSILNWESGPRLAFSGSNFTSVIPWTQNNQPIVFLKKNLIGCPDNPWVSRTSRIIWMTRNSPRTQSGQSSFPLPFRYSPLALLQPQTRFVLPGLTVSMFVRALVAQVLTLFHPFHLCPAAKFRHRSSGVQISPHFDRNLWLFKNLTSPDQNHLRVK